MKRLMLILLSVVFMAAAGCSGNDTQSQLKKIDELKNKGFPITAEQMEEIDRYVAEGRSLITEGKEKEASASLAKAINVLSLAQDADIYNKAD